MVLIDAKRIYFKDNLKLKRNPLEKLESLMSFYEEINRMKQRELKEECRQKVQNLLIQLVDYEQEPDQKDQYIQQLLPQKENGHQ